MDSPIKGRTRVLYAAMSLESFTIKELAEYAGVKERTVQTIIGRDKSLFVRLEKVRTGLPGGGAYRYAFNPAEREMMERSFRDLTGHFVAQHAPKADERDRDIQERIEIALGAVTESLDLARSARDEEEGSARQQQARAQLAHARVALSLGKHLDQHASFLRQLRSLEAALDGHSTGRAPGPILLSGLANQIQLALSDWVRPTPLSILRHCRGDDHASQPNWALLEEQVPALSPEEMWERMALFLESGSHWHDPALKELQKRLSQAFIAVDPEERTDHFCMLAAVAAVTEVGACIPLILRGLLEPGFEQRFDAHQRRVVLSSLARLGRALGTGTGEWELGAQACHLVLARIEPSANDLALLAPAVLGARMIDSAGLLDRIARTFYAGAHIICLDGATEEALLHNLGYTFHHSEFALLRTQVGPLLQHDSGRNLLAALNSPGSGALAILESADGGDFIIRAGDALIESLRLEAPPMWLFGEVANPSAKEFLQTLADRRSPAFLKPPEPCPSTNERPFLGERDSQLPMSLLYQRWAAAHAPQEPCSGP
jgi:hypothetical protein